MILKKTFFKLINNAVFGKLWKIYKKKKGIKLVKTERRRNYLALELNIWF